MRSVVLRKDGFYLRETDTSTWTEKPERLLDNGEWLIEWTEYLDGIEGKVTLGDVFAILAKLSEGERRLFSALAEAASIDAYIEEAQKPAASKSDLDYIETLRKETLDLMGRPEDVEDLLPSLGAANERWLFLPHLFS